MEEFPQLERVSGFVSLFVLGERTYHGTGGIIKCGADGTFLRGEGRMVRGIPGGRLFSAFFFFLNYAFFILFSFLVWFGVAGCGLTGRGEGDISRRHEDFIWGFGRIGGPWSFQGVLAGKRHGLRRRETKGTMNVTVSGLDSRPLLRLKRTMAGRL